MRNGYIYENWLSVLLGMALEEYRNFISMDDEVKNDVQNGARLWSTFVNGFSHSNSLSITVNALLRHK